MKVWILHFLSLALKFACAFHICQRPRTRCDVNLPARRREFIEGSCLLVGTSVLVSPGKVQAVGEGTERMIFRQKPTAPVGALLPAIQQRLLLEAVVNLAAKREIDKLKSILLPLNEDTLGQKPDLKVLKEYDPALVICGDLTRAAMNLYQTNLNYSNLLSNPSEAFAVTDPDWKKSYIRANDGLPDLKRLIGADIDMRQLLRNQVQMKLDDASAELYATDFDERELQTLVREAAQSFDLWLDRVRPGDIQDALQAAMKGEKVKIYESYAAGFLPY